MRIKSILLALALAAGTSFAQQTMTTGINKANMDLSAVPGDDFFTYADGGWNKSHPLTPEFPRYSQFDALQETNRKQLRELVEGLAAENHKQGSLEQKIGSLYRLAMDSTRRNAEDYAPIKPLLAEVRGLETRDDVHYEMARFSALGISNFFSIGCQADIKDSKWNLMEVNQGGISMGERTYYLADDEPTVKIREAYKQYVTKILEMTGLSATEAQKSMEAVLSIETNLSKAHYDVVKLRNSEANYHKMSYRQLLRDYPGIDWSTIFHLNSIPAFENISVAQPEAIKEAERVLRETPVEDLKAYLYFKVVDDAANYLSDRFRAVSFDFYSHTMSGAEQDKPRWKRALGIVEGALGMAVGRMYVEKYFPETSKQRMVQLVKNLQVALGERIDQQSWMSVATKAKAHEKLDAFYVKIGYPDQWMDYSGLNIDENLSLYENMTNATQFMSKYYTDKRVNKPVDRDEWLMTPQTVNAYYNPTTNEICFPAGILQPPYFDANADDASNYGAIGVVIGHEMTHGFDDQGAQFDKDGNLNNWWTAADGENFKKRTDALKNYFSTLEVLPGLHCNGALTNGENIADHGGINVAFQALQNAMQVNPLSKVDGFTPEQRFFLSYALVWAGNTREAFLRQLVNSDPHSPARLRVNGTLPHINAWYKAFNVKKKNKLFVPEKKRVDVW